MIEVNKNNNNNSRSKYIYKQTVQTHGEKFIMIELRRNQHGAASYIHVPKKWLGLNV